MTVATRSTLALRQVPLLNVLGDAQLERVAQQCAWRTLAAHQFLVRRSEVRREVHFLISGAARVTSYSSGGRQVSFRDVQAGECLGVLAALDAQPRSADILSTQDSVLATISKDDFSNLLDQEPAFARAVMVHLSMLVRQLSERLIELSTLEVSNRLQAELLRRARLACEAQAGMDRSTGGTTGVRGAGLQAHCEEAKPQVRLDPFPSHEVLASLISTSREQVTRELNRLVRDGVLRKEGGALVVCDYRRLEELMHARQTAPLDLDSPRSRTRGSKPLLA